MNRTISAIAGAVGAALAFARPVLADDDAAAWRLFVGDHAAPTVTAIDLGAPDRRWTFDVGGPARLCAAADDALVVAVQSDDDRVDFLRSGIELASHGDHGDMEVPEPEPPGSITGPRPFHVVARSGEVAIAMDRGGYAAVLDEAALLRGETEARRVPMNVAHHGFVAGMGDHVTASVASEEPMEEGKPPPRVGIGAFRADGTPLGETHACTDLRGEAFSGVFLVAGCAEGVIAHDTTGGPDAFTMLPYPADLPEDGTGTLLGAAAMQVFPGDHDGTSVVIVDPTAEPYFARVELPFREVDFALDPARPQHACILAEDGSLHRLDMPSAEIDASVGATRPYSMDGHWRDPRPRMAVAGDRPVLADPLDASLRVVDLERFAEIDRIAVEGMPYDVVATGGSGLTY